MPFWWNLGCMVVMLSKVHPSVATRDFFLCVIVFKIFVAELVHANESP